MQEKKRKHHNELDGKIGNSNLVYKKSLHESDNSREQAVPESGGTCFKLFVSSVWRERGEERMTSM